MNFSTHFTPNASVNSTSAYPPPGGGGGGGGNHVAFPNVASPEGGAFAYPVRPPGI